MSKTMVFVGTYTDPILFGTGEVFQGRGEGIYAFELNETTGDLTLRHVTPGVTNPSYLALDTQRRSLYAVNELKIFEGRPTGTVSAFSVDPLSGALHFLNKRSTSGTDPCHVTVDRKRRMVFVANFMSGSVCALTVQADGSLGEVSTFIQHEGSSVDPKRQSGPHAHSTVLDGENRFAFVPDLGLDRVMSYRLDDKNGRMTPNDIPWLQVKPGSGPRHLAFHPDGRYAYIINELDSTLIAAAYDHEKGSLHPMQTLSTLPPGFAGASTCADIQVCPSGDFVFGSNRGHDSIAMFGVDHGTGRLTALGYQATGGKTPRSFGIDPTGVFLLVANQASDSIVTLRIDGAKGRLEPTGKITNVPTPTCVVFAQGSWH